MISKEVLSFFYHLISSPLPPCSLFPVPTLSGSCLFRFIPLQGIPHGWLTENTSYWTTQTGPQASSNSAHKCTQQQTHTCTCSGCTEFASVILWVTKWSSGDGRGIWKAEVIIFQGFPQWQQLWALLIWYWEHLRGAQTDNQNNIERWRGWLKWQRKGTMI